MPDAIIFQILARDQASGTTDKVIGRVEILESDLKRLTGATDQNSAAADRAKRSWTAHAESLSQFGAVSLKVSAALGGLLALSVRQAVSWDQSRRALKAVTGSAAEAERQFQRIIELGELPGLDVEPLLEAMPVLQQMGMAFAEAETMMKGFGTAITAMGKTPESLRAAMVQVTESIRQNRMEMEDLRIAEQHGLPVLQTLKDEYGLTLKELQELNKAGLSAKDIWLSLSEAMGRNPKFAAAAAENMGSAANKITNFGTSLKLLADTAGRQFLDPLAKTLDRITEYIKDLKPDQIQQAARGLAAMAAVAGGLGLTAVALGKIVRFAADLKALGLLGAAGAAGAVGGAGAVVGVGALAGKEQVERHGWGQTALRAIPGPGGIWGIAGRLAGAEISDRIGSRFSLEGMETAADPRAAAILERARGGGGGGTAKGGNDALREALELHKQIVAEKERLAKATRAVAWAEAAIQMADSPKQELAARQKIVEALIRQKALTKDVEDAEKLSVRIALEKHERTALIREEHEKGLKKLKEQAEFDRKMVLQKTELAVLAARTPQEEIRAQEQVLLIMRLQYNTLKDKNEQAEASLDIRRKEIEIAQMQAQLDDEAAEKAKEKAEAARQAANTTRGAARGFVTEDLQAEVEAWQDLAKRGIDPSIEAAARLQRQLDLLHLQQRTAEVEDYWRAWNAGEVDRAASLQAAYWGRERQWQQAATETTKAYYAALSEADQSRLEAQKKYLALLKEQSKEILGQIKAKEAEQKKTREAAFGLPAQAAGMLEDLAGQAEKRGDWKAARDYRQQAEGYRQQAGQAGMGRLQAIWGRGGVDATEEKLRGIAAIAGLVPGAQEVKGPPWQGGPQTRGGLGAAGEQQVAALVAGAMAGYSQSATAGKTEYIGPGGRIRTELDPASLAQMIARAPNPITLQPGAVQVNFDPRFLADFIVQEINREFSRMHLAVAGG